MHVLPHGRLVPVISVVYADSSFYRSAARYVLGLFYFVLEDGVYKYTQSPFPIKAEHCFGVSVDKIVFKGLFTFRPSSKALCEANI